MKNWFLLFLAYAICNNACTTTSCPPDEDHGEVNLQNTSVAFLPGSITQLPIEFVNAAGEKLAFTETLKTSTFDYNLDTLCTETDFPYAPTYQVSFFEIQKKTYSFESANDGYSLSLNLLAQNAGTSKNPADTAFYEMLVVEGKEKRVGGAYGSFSMLTSLRGNGIPKQFRDVINQYRIVQDTVLNGRHIVNAYVPLPNNNNNLFIFYTKTNGVEAFTTDTEVWVRE